MNKEQTKIMKRWVKRLRAKRYKKGYAELRHRDQYCVLGVLCDTLAAAYPKTYRWGIDRIGNSTFRDLRGKETTSVDLPKRVADKLGFRTTEVMICLSELTPKWQRKFASYGFAGDRLLTLTQINDVLPFSLKQLATLIEDNAEAVFKKPVRKRRE